MLYMWFHFVYSQVSDEASVIYYASMKPDLRTEWKVEIILIITDPHEILLFSLCIKSTIVVFKMTKQLSEENGGGPFCQQGNYQG